MTWFTRRAWLVPLPAALLCCSFVLDPAETQCATDGDCARRGAAFAGATCVQNVCQTLVTEAGTDAGDAGDAGDATGPLRCLGTASYVPPDSSRQITLRQQFVVQEGQKPIQPGQATIKLCSRTDLPCTSPRAVLDTDVKGFVTTQVEFGFTGYFDFTAPGLQSSIYVITPVLSENKLSVPLQALNPDTAQYLASTLVSTQIEPTLGNTIVAIIDCNGERFGGITIKAAVVDSQNRTRDFYIRSSASVSPGATETNQLGQAGFINLPPGIANITGTLNVERKVVVGIEMPIRAGYFSYALLTPEEYVQ